MRDRPELPPPEGRGARGLPRRGVGLADPVAAEDVRRGVILSLVTGVSQAYFELRELDLEMEIALRTRDSFQQTLDLFTRQLVGGVGNKLATSRAAAALASTAATIPD